MPYVPRLRVAFAGAGSSRQPRSLYSGRATRGPEGSLLSVRNLFNAIKGLPHAEERPFATPAVAPQYKLARPEAPTTAVQPLSSQALWLIALCSAARQFPDWRQRRAGFEQCLEARQDFWPANGNRTDELGIGLIDFVGGFALLPDVHGAARVAFFV